jgi:pimeloyl-ACP methyl ester carboxylesterase
VSAALCSMGHEVFSPTHRGCEQGVGVDRVGVDLTAIGDGLVDAVRDHDLQDFVMVGHSGGGPAAQYAADRLAEQSAGSFSLTRGCCMTGPPSMT